MEGLSLFQGAGSINVNSDQQRVEEEDAIADRQRRHEEMNHELQNLFEDLPESDEDHDTSVSYQANSSGNLNNFGGLIQSNQIFNGMENHHKAHNDNHHIDPNNEISRLKNVLASKNEELRNLTSEFTSERVSFQNKIEELKKRFAIAEAEKERAIMGKQKTHELLVESKQKLSERDEKMSELSAKIKAYDAKNLELLGELERTKTALNEVQHKYNIVEKNNSYSSEKYTDSVVKQLKDRHAAERDMLQQQINTMRTKLEDRDGEVKRLTIQINEVQKSREGLLIDKADMINELSKRLDDSQSKCQELIMKTASQEDSAQENLRLMRSITDLQRQNDEMQRTIHNLTSRLETTTTELEHITETAINDSGSNSPLNGIMETPLIRRAVSQPRLGMSSTPATVEDRITRLKEEFNRCVADQKLKRQEILALKAELDAKNKQINQLKADENHALIELTTTKENAERMAIRLKNAERELEESNTKTQTNYEQNTKDENELMNRLHELQRENENFRSSCNHLNETIRGLEDERDSIEEKYREACKEMAELQQEITKLKSSPCLECEKEKFLAKDAQQECTRLKELYMRVNDDKEEVVRKLRQLEAHDLNKELLEQRNIVANLERSLQLVEMKYNETAKILEREKIDHETQMQNLRAKYEQEMSAAETKEQKDVSNSCIKCIDLSTKIAKFDIENLQLQTTCSGYLKDIHELKKSLKKADQTISDLVEKLALKHENDALLDELKSKAKQFEEFMQNQSPSKSILVDVVAHSQTSRVRDQCVSTEDLCESPQSSGARSSPGLNRSAEKKIREDMARAMAQKVKGIENVFKQQILEQDKQIEDLSSEVHSLQTTLKDRDTDISNLKKCILKERSEVKYILEQKETDFTETMTKHKNKLIATRNELELANKQIDTLLNELDQCRRTFQGERESMSKLMNEWKAELDAFAEREKSHIEQIRQMETSHKATVDSLNEKYVAAKKTAVNYKKYSDEKEKHIERESERIKAAYEQAVEKIKENMRTALKEQEKQSNKRIAEIRAQLDAVNQRQK